MSESLMVQRLRIAIEHAEDNWRDVQLDKHDAKRILARLLYGCGERNKPVRHP